VVRVGALGSLALVIRAILQRVVNIDLLDDQDPVFDVDLTLGL